jgi:hypothetical protein
VNQSCINRFPAAHQSRYHNRGIVLPEDAAAPWQRELTSFQRTLKSAARRGLSVSSASIASESRLSAEEKFAFGRCRLHPASGFFLGDNNEVFRKMVRRNTKPAANRIDVHVHPARYVEDFQFSGGTSRL